MTVQTQAQPPAARGAAAPVPRVDSRAFWNWVWTSIYPVIGWILVLAGAIIIIIGWWGVARNAIVAKQLPYLASGAIGGLALISLGGRFMVIRDLREDSGRLDRLEQMVLELHEVLLRQADAAGIPSAHGATRAATATANRTTTSQLVALPRGGRYHRADCRVVAGKDDATTISRAQVRRRALTPCPLCEPDAS